MTMPNLENSDRQLPGASMQVVESAVDLLRAEGRLALVHTRYLGVHALSALLLVVVGAASLQVALLVCVAAPVLSAWLSGLQLALAIVVPASLAVATLAFAYTHWKEARTLAQAPRGAGPRLEEVA
jgi:hypothetical protein